jgi:hypothetical protein
VRRFSLQFVIDRVS